MPYRVNEDGNGGRANSNQVAGGAAAAKPFLPDMMVNTQGITWLELYTLYRLAGHPEPLSYDRAQATSRPTLRQQLHTFRHATRQLVHATMAAEYQHLFKGIACMHGKRLHTLGVNTNVAILP